MKHFFGFLTLATSLALGSMAGCSDDDDSDGTAGSAGTDTAGAAGVAGTNSTGGTAGTTGGSAGTTGGSAGTTGGTAGSAGTTGGAAGSAGTTGGAAGSGGTAGMAGTAGAAGTGGGTGALMVGGCTEADAVDQTAGQAIVTRVGFAYEPRCTKIKAGQSVIFKDNSGVHPLKGMTATGDQPNPLAGPFETEQTVTYTAAGNYGFYCTVHGGEGVDENTSAMAGSIIVE